MNSMQSIEDRIAGGWDIPGRIRITVTRPKREKTLFDSDAIPPVIQVQIDDNGIGFDESHFSAFQRLDDDFRAAKGGKGIGRLSWLSGFKKVQITSIHRDATERLHKRSFDYAIEADGIQNEVNRECEDTAETGATICLMHLHKEFQDNWPKKPLTFIDRLVAHFQKSLVLPTCPPIEVSDPELPEVIELKTYFKDNFLVDRSTTKFHINSDKFEVIHLLHRLSGEGPEQRHSITMLANGRPAEDPIAIPSGLGVPKGAIKCEGALLYYSAFVSSEFINGRTNDSRTHVDMPTQDNALPGEVTRDEMISKTALAGRKFLGDRVKAMYDELQQRIERICVREVRYRPLLKHCSKQLSEIEPSLSEAKLEDVINAIYRDYMEQLRSRTRKISKRAAQHIDDLEAFKSEVSEMLESWNEMATSDLATYVAHRRVILWFLQERLRLRDTGKYHFEDSVHAIFFPMGFDSEGFPVSAANLWLIDERMSFHEYLASDMAIKRHELLTNDSANEPDITIYDAAYAFGPREEKRGTITLVEFKRPGRDDYTMDDNPYTQAIGYIEDIRDGDIKFRDGRPINDSRSVRFFVYLIADHSKSLRKILSAYDFHETSDGRGYFKNTDRAYFEVTTYEKVIEDAISRHRAFFDKLHLPENAGGGMGDE